MDMIVRLYDLPDNTDIMRRMDSQGIRVVRAMTPDRARVLDFVRKEFEEGWASELETAFGSHPVTCYIAINAEHEVVGFGGYDCTCKAYFGPTGVRKDCRGKGIGGALLAKCMEGLRELGYAYAIIGDAATSARAFYAKVCGAADIPGSEIGIYRDLIGSK